MINSINRRRLHSRISHGQRTEPVWYSHWRPVLPKHLQPISC